MKRLVFVLFAFIFSISFAKENRTFVGFKVSNGRTVFNYRYTINGVKVSDKQKLFYSGVYFNYGGTIKNFSIYSGIGYNLYQYKYEDLLIDFNGTGLVLEKNPRRNFSLINIPVNVDYNINIYKQKLFFVIGLGGEICITVKEQFKSSERKISADLSDIKKVSFAISARSGFLYNINKRFDMYTYFDYSHHLTRYLKANGVDYGSGRNGIYPFNVAGSIGFNVKLNKKAKEIPKAN